MSEKIASTMRPLGQGPMAERKTKSTEAKLREVADLYEKHFMREMVKQMRATVHESGLIQTNQAEKIFREQLDDQYVDKWSSRGGVGFSDVIYNQLMEKFGAQLGLKAPVQKPVGPLPLPMPTDKTAASAEIRHGEKSLNMLIESQEREVRAPWAGVLLRQVELAPEEHFLEIEHDNGLKSQLLFKGLAPSLGLPAKILDGQRLGLMSPDKGQLVWNIQANVSE